MTALAGAALFLGLLQADELEKRFKSVVAQLGSEKPEERAAAQAELAKLIARDRKLLRGMIEEALEEEKDAEVREALARATARTYSLDDVTLEVQFSKPALTVREAGSSKTQFRMRVRNADAGEIVLVRDFGLEVLDPEGKALGTSAYIGAGIRPSGCFLKAAPFITIPGGHVLEWEECLSAYGSEMRAFKGYEPPRPGAYTLRFTYAYDAAAFKAHCTDRCPGHEDLERPWNRALAGKKVFEVKLVVREETPDEKAASAAHEKWIQDLMERYRAKKITVTQLHEEVDKAGLDYRDRQRVLSVTRE